AAPLQLAKKPRGSLLANMPWWNFRENVRERKRDHDHEHRTTRRARLAQTPSRVPVDAGLAAYPVTGCKATRRPAGAPSRHTVDTRKRGVLIRPRGRISKGRSVVVIEAQLIACR